MYVYHVFESIQKIDPAIVSRKYLLSHIPTSYLGTHYILIIIELLAHRVYHNHSTIIELPRQLRGKCAPGLSHAYHPIKKNLKNTDFYLIRSLLNSRIWFFFCLKWYTNHQEPTLLSTRDKFQNKRDQLYPVTFSELENSPEQAQK